MIPRWAVIAVAVLIVQLGGPERAGRTSVTESLQPASSTEKALRTRTKPRTEIARHATSRLDVVVPDAIDVRITRRWSSIASSAERHIRREPPRPRTSARAPPC